MTSTRPCGALSRCSFGPSSAALCATAEAPAAFALDVGVTTAGATLVVEVNDGYALGAYRLMPLAYAKFLSARWAQLTGTEDYANF